MQNDLAESETLLSTVSMTAARVVNKSAVRIEKFHFRMNLSSICKIERDNDRVIPDAGDVEIVGADTIATLSAQTSEGRSVAAWDQRIVIQQLRFSIGL